MSQTIETRQLLGFQFPDPEPVAAHELHYIPVPVIQSADAALYQAKAQGRERSVIAS